MPKPPWSSSDRAKRLPPDWQERRAQVLKRDPRCQLHYACMVATTKRHCAGSQCGSAIA